ncbi:MAG: hypothetical protein V7711_05780 [Pseudomonadales bacterium]
MDFKKIVGKLIFGELTADLETYGSKVEETIINTLDATPVEYFKDLRSLTNLKGDDTGFVKVFTAPKLDRVASLSIDIMPGMRYFNIHIIPDHHYNIPRYSFEGMVTTKGSQLSMDLYPDMDMIMDFDYIDRHFSGVAKVYEKAKKHKLIKPEPSRLPHMRVLCSPYFLLANKVPQEALVDMQGFALSYFDQWLKIYQAAEVLNDSAAEERLARRILIAKTIIENDPDRDKVVDTYGEEKTQLIEKAAML